MAFVKEQTNCSIRQRANYTYHISIWGTEQRQGARMALAPETWRQTDAKQGRSSWVAINPRRMLVWLGGANPTRDGLGLVEPRAFSSAASRTNFDSDTSSFLAARASSRRSASVSMTLNCTGRARMVMVFFTVIAMGLVSNGGIPK